MSTSRNLHISDTILRRALIWILTFSCFLFNGCSPAAFAATALAFSLWDQQVKNERAEQLHLARQQKSETVSRQQEIVRPIVQQPAIPSIVERAVQAYKNLQWDEASRLLKDALKRGEFSISEKCVAYIILGSIAYQQGNIKESEDYFKKHSNLGCISPPSAELYPPSLIDFYRKVRSGRK